MHIWATISPWMCPLFKCNYHPVIQFIHSSSGHHPLDIMCWTGCKQALFLLQCVSCCTAVWMVIWQQLGHKHSCMQRSAKCTWARWSQLQSPYCYPDSLAVLPDSVSHGSLCKRDNTQHILWLTMHSSCICMFDRVMVAHFARLDTGVWTLFTGMLCLPCVGEGGHFELYTYWFDRQFLSADWTIRVFVRETKAFGECPDYCSEMQYWAEHKRAPALARGECWGRKTGRHPIRQLFFLPVASNSICLWHNTGVVLA